MSDQVVSALNTLSLSMIGGLGTLITALCIWLARKLDRNTTITTETRDSSSNLLSATLEEKAALSNLVVGLRALLRERDDQIAYIISRHPDVEATRLDYARSRERVSSEADEIAAERRARGV